MVDFRHRVADFIDFKDMDQCIKVRNIKKKDIEKTSNPNLTIKVIRNEEFIFKKIVTMFKFIKDASDRDKKLVLVMPNPHPDYKLLAYLINTFNVNCNKLWTFNMDEFIDKDGKVAPDSWPYGFNYSFLNNFYYQVDKKLRPPRDQVIGFNDKNIEDYGNMIEEQGGADVIFGGIGWSGHIAYIEPGSPEFHAETLEEFLELSSRTVTLDPLTIAQYCLTSSGDWSCVSPKAVTIGPKEIMKGKSFQSWNGHYVPETNITWQRFIVRLALHGPVSRYIPASILQLRKTEFFIREVVAENI